jgi:predicted transposase YdaD
VMGQLYANEELLAQEKASDQWSYYQAKTIRRYESNIARDLFKHMPGEQAAKASETYVKNGERYEEEGKEIQTEAQKLEAESDLKGRQALRLHIGEIFLEIGIVFATLAILTKRPVIWWTSMISAAAGAAIAITARLILH